MRTGGRGRSCNTKLKNAFSVVFCALQRHLYKLAVDIDELQGLRWIKYDMGLTRSVCVSSLCYSKAINLPTKDSLLKLLMDLSGNSSLMNLCSAECKLFMALQASIL